MKKILIPVFAVILATAASYAQSDSGLVPEMQNRLDSVSLYLGVAVGSDMVGSFSALDTQLVTLGLLYGYTSGADLTDDTTEFLDGFFAPFIYTDAVADARELIPTLPGTDPRYIGRPSIPDGADKFPDIVLPAGIPGVVRANTGEHLPVPKLETMIDSVFYYRAAMEGRMVSQVMDRIAFPLFAKGFFAGYIADDKFDKDFISAYLTEYFFGITYDGETLRDTGFPARRRSGPVTLPEGVAPPNMASMADSVAFFLGLDTGMSYAEMGLDLDPRMLAKGVEAGFTHHNEIEKYEIHEFLNDYFYTRLPLEQLRASEAYLDSLSAGNPSLSRSESGLLYEVIDRGDMSHRAVSKYDTVEVLYTGTLPDGTVFDSTDSPVSLTVGSMISGFGEGLTYVGKGGRIKLYLHPSLAYGERSSGAIPSNSVILFDVTVVDAPQVEE